MAAAFDLEIWQYDAVSAFINSCVDEEIFCECPDDLDALAPLEAAQSSVRLETGSDAKA
jgi:hypothetical protein